MGLINKVVMDFAQDENQIISERSGISKYSLTEEFLT